MPDTSRIAVIGLGRRSLRYALPCITRQDKLWHLAAVCDPSDSARAAFSNSSETAHLIPSYSQVASMISTEIVRIDCAYVAVPHAQGYAVSQVLLEANIHVLREKPAAMSAAEVASLQAIAKTNGVTYISASQFRYSEQFRCMQQWMTCIGQVKYVRGLQSIDVQDLGAGWRASRVLAGGGVLIDMGWHLLDTMLSLLQGGTESQVEAVQALQTRPWQQYDCEDTLHATIRICDSEFAAKGSSVICDLTVTRAGLEKQFVLVISGEHGLLRMDGDVVELRRGTLVETKRLDEATGPSTFANMMADFYESVKGLTIAEGHLMGAARDIRTMRVIDNVYIAVRERTKSTSLQARVSNRVPDLSPDSLRFVWPVINAETETVIRQQLHDSISIYDRSGIFATFEQEWKTFHNVRDSFALLHNSGTNALQALFFSAELRPGDEIIFPVYSFHATSSPAIQFGAVPIFCDADAQGNISAEAIGQALTVKTRIVVVTHMWGIPCNMRAIQKVLDKRPDVLLFEDCSHAHGASIDGQMVGTFGDAAAWSIQGQKIITGGEGGVSLTRHAEIYYRQLIWGHYNKRCKAEIPKDHSLRRFALTGAGNKNRAHPLAVAMANQQLRCLSDTLRWKRLFAIQMISALADVDFVRVPDIASLASLQFQPAWYALTLIFDKARAPRGLTREKFVEDLHTRGLLEVDIPKSTKLLHDEPLYTSPDTIFPHLYRGYDRPKEQDIALFPAAKAFFEAVFKLPVWSSRTDESIVKHYIDVIKDVAKSYPTPLVRDVKL